MSTRRAKIKLPKVKRKDPLTFSQMAKLEAKEKEELNLFLFNFL